MRARQGTRSIDLAAKAVVLAAGGFEANAEWRTRYLGPGWELAKVRGSRFNTGDGLRMALEIGAMACGNWSGCHSASWDLGAPDVNELAHGAVFKRDDFLYGIMVNARGERFVDEGADIRALTYAKMGRAILAQPGQVAWQIFDGKTRAPAARRISGSALVRAAAQIRSPSWRASFTASTAMLFSPPSSTSIARCNATSRSIRARRTAAAPWDLRCRSRTGPPPSTSRRSRPIR